MAAFLVVLTRTVPPLLAQIRSAALRLLNQPAPQQALLAVRQASTGEVGVHRCDASRKRFAQLGPMPLLKQLQAS